MPGLELFALVFPPRRSPGGGGGALAIVDGGGGARDCWRGGFITTMRPGASLSANQLVNTPPKRPSSRGGAIARGSFACSGHWAFHGEYR